MKFKGIIPEVKMSEFELTTVKHMFKLLKPYKVISVNTSSLFKGNLEILKRVRKEFPKKFLIRKDFIMIPRQIKESKEAGADAVLLIWDLLRPEQYQTLVDACQDFDIVHITEISGTKQIGYFPGTILVNSRNLNSGEINKDRAEGLCELIRLETKNIIYASGECSDIVVKKGIADAVLIGTAFMQGKIRGK